MLSLLAYIGGLKVVFLVIGACLVGVFARTNLNAMIGNRLYTWEPPASLMMDVKREDAK